jgi:heme A synthase
VTTVLLVTIGVVVRATGSGMGCPDWPLCYGQLVPPLDDYKAWLEWVHRTVAAVIGFEILGLALLAILDHRDRRSILWPALGVQARRLWAGWARRSVWQQRVGHRAPGRGAARGAADT